MKLVAIITVLIGLARLCFLPTIVSGDSMEPTLGSGEIHLADQRLYRNNSPIRGDVVLAQKEQGGDLVVKRIVGLPGEEIKMVWGRIYIDGVLLEEPYLHPESGWCMLPKTLGEGEYWIIGDNRDVSLHLTVGREEIVGKLITPSIHEDPSSQI